VLTVAPLSKVTPIVKVAMSTTTGVLDVAKVVQTSLLTAAMFALGTGVHIATIKKVGARPFVLSAIATIWVAGIALAGVLLTNVSTSV
jgi:uncharacterized membrane protein YadS